MALTKHVVSIFAQKNGPTKCTINTKPFDMGGEGPRGGSPCRMSDLNIGNAPCHLIG